MSVWKVAQAAVCAGMLAAASACGGGGGGSGGSTPETPTSPPPPPPPPPSNAAPTARIATPNGTEADERQVLVLDGSTSTDADGDTLTFRWTQTSGPAAEVVSPENPVTDVVLPDVDSNTDIVFELSVSDGKQTITATQSLTALNIDLQPRYENARLLPVVNIGSETAAVEMVRRVHRASFEGDREPADISGLRRTGNGVEFFLQRGSEEDFGPAVTTATRFTDLREQFAIFSENINPLTATFEIAIASRADNLIQVFQRDDEQRGSQPNVGRLGDIEVTAPCSLAYGLGFMAPSDPFLSSVLIAGKADGTGIELFARAPDSSGAIDPGNYNFRTSVTNNGTFCTLATVWFGPMQINAFFDLLVGVDLDTNRIRTFISTAITPGGSILPISEISAANIRRGASGSLSIVDSAISGRGANMQGPLDVLVLLAGAEHNDGHAVEVYRLNLAGNPVRPTEAMYFELATTLSWGKGRPKKIIEHDANGDGENDIVILLESAPYLVVFTRKVDPTGTTPPLELNEAQFLEVGFGFDDLTQHDSDQTLSRGVMLTKRETGELQPVRTHTFTWP